VDIDMADAKLDPIAGYFNGIVQYQYWGIFLYQRIRRLLVDQTIV
jgi:hypothetical protein